MSAPILLSAHHRAMHALYSEHHGWLQNWLRGKLGCAADAADLAQDTFSRMLDGLKPKVRTAFLLAQCEDLSHRQIAERMGVSQRSVERYVAEALYHCYLLRYGE
ncbi:hypothetical protein B5L72_34410 [Pseudomonas aeruginosa]|uniref:sigma factor-like helix-turn-helix DNA-binding protein n=1 Tax=Pseudomonas aeruginosa TaxID=287 RepID=UPI0009A90A9C|nr:sigma factor-like helix-turn-helix DNA-binding protein [Pseudomonas aeruginosa]OPL22089.1 hypothetical protein B5L72_34410 [Pseudomonas aeruginosa]